MNDFKIYDVKDTLVSHLDALFGSFAADDAAAEFARELGAFGSAYRIEGNVWHAYIAYVLATAENPFTLAAERRDLQSSCSVCKLAEHDMQEFFTLMRTPLDSIPSLGFCAADALEHFVPCDASPKEAHAELIGAFAARLEAARTRGEFFSTVKDFHRRHGAGKLALSRAFRLQNAKDGGTCLRGIINTDARRFDDLVGIEFQKKQLIDNTEAFLDGRPANNVLLYGDGGTGKSSSIKALINEYGDRGLRIIEIYKHQFDRISDLIGLIKNRNYRFILYLDDLSFEEFEIEYKYFKAIIDGGLEAKPENMLIYATSNRRHLVKENYSDRNDMVVDDDLHRSDTLNEKLSLVARFGLSIFYPSPNQEAYLEIVRQLAARNGIDMPRGILEQRALQWQMRGSGKSGRSAQQFINSLL